LLKIEQSDYSRSAKYDISACDGFHNPFGIAGFTAPDSWFVTRHPTYRHSAETKLEDSGCLLDGFDKTVADASSDIPVFDKGIPKKQKSTVNKSNGMRHGSP
jgi:hypothetical protein